MNTLTGQPAGWFIIKRVIEYVRYWDGKLLKESPDDCYGWEPDARTEARPLVEVTPDLCRVKALEWETKDGGWFCHGGLFSYMISMSNGGYRVFEWSGWEFAETCVSLAAAKLAAESHYRERLAQAVTFIGAK